MDNLALLIYYTGIITVGVLLGPFLLLKRRARYGLQQKLGVVPDDLKEKFSKPGAVRPIWFHAVSVGEFNAAWPLLRRLNESHPQQPIVISTTTGAGHKLAQERASGFADCIYFPYDLPWSVTNWLDSLNPKLVTIVETEIWPGFVHQCKQRRIPIAIVNGRMSPRSYGRYYKMRAFFGPVLRDFSKVGVQSRNEAERYKMVAGEGLPVDILGNIKFDGLKAITSDEREELRQMLNLQVDDKVIVVGSTHEGEEALILSAYKQLNQPAVRLIIAPRHPERFDRVADLIRLAGFRPRRFSEKEKFEQEGNIYLLDSIGQLAKFYSVATVAFVGGTLVPIGGHNVVEPYAYSVPVIAGRYLHKTKDVADALIACRALTVVNDDQELASQLNRLLADKTLRDELGALGADWLKESQGAVDRALTMIESLVDLNSAKIETTQGERR